MKKIVLLIISCLGTVILADAQSPSFLWAKHMGGVLNDEGKSIVVDVSGNVYTTGNFQGTTDFDPGVGTFNLTAVGYINTFISKLDASGNFLWAKQFSGTSFNYGYSIAVDASGNVYTTGYFSGTTDFDPGTGTFNLTATGVNNNAFISKLDASGNFLWAKNIRGTSSSGGFSITLDVSGNIYTTGFFNGTADFDPGSGTYNLIATGNADIFISKLDVSGNFLWAKHFPVTYYGYGQSIAVDISGNVYTTGYFGGIVDFDPGIGTFNLTSASNYDVYVSKLDVSGNFLWAKQMGGSSDDEGYSIALDVSGNVYTTGYFSGTVDFDPGIGIFNLSSNGNTDIFISKLSSSGNFLWAKQLGGTLDDKGYSIALDVAGNIYTTGHFNGTADFDPGTGVFNLTTLGVASDIFISKLDTSGSFLWAKNIGGIYTDEGYSIALDGVDNIYTTGYFIGTVNFDLGGGTYNLITHIVTSDIFVYKVSQSISTAVINENDAVLGKILIYPNPGNSIFNILVLRPTKALQIEIYNTLGILVSTQTITGNEINSIDFTTKASGLYFVKVISDNKIIAGQEIIKE